MIEKVCVDIGGTNIKAARVIDGVLSSPLLMRKSHGKDGKDAILKSLFSVIDKLITPDCQGIGISIPGFIDHINGVCTFISDNLKGMSGCPLKEILENRYHIETNVENDAFCHLNAEYRARNTNNVTLLTLGTGLGGASIIDGKLDRTRKTNWGYRVIVPGGVYLKGADEYGTAEAYLGLKAINAALEPYQPQLTIKNLFESFLKGDDNAKAILTNYCHYLEMVLDLIQREINPDVIVIGGGIASNRQIFEQLIDMKARKCEFALHGNQAGIIGSYYLPIK